MTIARARRALALVVGAVCLCAALATAPGAAAPAAAAPAAAAPAAAAVDPALAARLQATLDGWRESHHAPGVAAAVRLPDGSLWLGVSGRASVGRDGRSVKPTTPFVVGSITKTFMAALVLQLQEDGELSIDDPIAKWLPAWPKADRITVAMLLGHRSGIFDYFTNPRYESLVFGRPHHLWTPTQILRLRGPSYFEPGKGFHYSNTNYVLLGQIVRKVTGRDPAELIRERFLDPLGMRETFFQGDEPVGRWPAMGYWTAGRGWRGFSDGSRLRPHTSAATVAWTAGAMVASVRDLATWEHALLEGTVLKPESLALMLDFGSRSGYGLGMRRQVLAEREGLGHGGSLRGFVAGMYRLPVEDVDVIVLTNLGNVNVHGIFTHLTRIALRAVVSG